MFSKWSFITDLLMRMLINELKIFYKLKKGKLRKKGFWQISASHGNPRESEDEVSRLGEGGMTSQKTGKVAKPWRTRSLPD